MVQIPFQAPLLAFLCLYLTVRWLPRAPVPQRLGGEDRNFDRAPGAVWLDVFNEPGSRQVNEPLSLQLETTDGFSVIARRAGQPAHGLVLSVSFASDDSKRGGCLLQETDIPGQYRCYDAEFLDPGGWNATIWLLRQPKFGRSDCLPQGDNEREWLPLVDYLISMNVSDASSLRPPNRCFDFPLSIVLVGRFTRPRLRTVRGQVKLATEPIECGDDPSLPGRWIPIQQLPQHRQEFMPDPFLVANDSNAKSEAPIAHVFAPFRCYYPLRTRIGASSLMQRLEPLLFGDSRIRNLKNHFKYWTGIRLPFISILDRLGLAGVVSDVRLVRVLRALKAGRPVIFSSLLHDFADFRETTPISVIRKLYPDHCTTNCTGETVAQCPHCEQKHWQIQNFLASVASLRAALRAEGPFPGTLFFVSIGVCPPHPIWKRQHYAPDILEAAQDRAADMLKGYVEHIDLRPMIWAMDPRWCLDMSHFNRGEGTSSLVEHMQLQMILHRLGIMEESEAWRRRRK